MSGLFGSSANTYAAGAPGLMASETMQGQNYGLQAQNQQLQAGNAISQAGYNAGLTALQGHLTRENEAEQFNGGGVLLEGSPLAQLEQTRQLALSQINNIQQQGMLQGQTYNTEANQTLNQGAAQLLGMSNNYQVGQANAQISDTNNQANLEWQGIQDVGKIAAQTGTGQQVMGGIAKFLQGI